MRRALLFAVLALGLRSGPAWAQSAAADVVRVAAGARHMVGELDHLLAILALALLAGQAGGRALVWTPGALAVGLVVGAHSGAVMPLLPQVETLNLASIAILGALVASGLRFPTFVPVIVGLAFAWGHGYANVLDIGGQTPPPAFVLGLVAGALGTLVTVSMLTSPWRAGWRRIAVRAVGSWICAIGMMVLALRLAGE